MDVYERSRHQLHERLQEAIGPEAAGTLMAHLPPGGFERLVTKDDLNAVEERLTLRMDAMRQELRAEMHQLGRSLMLSMTTVMTILLGIMFAALRMSG
jgi:hypothetical protein